MRDDWMCSCCIRDPGSLVHTERVVAVGFLGERGSGVCTRDICKLTRFSRVRGGGGGFQALTLFQKVAGRQGWCILNQRPWRSGTTSLESVGAGFRLLASSRRAAGRLGVLCRDLGELAQPPRESEVTGWLLTLSQWIAGRQGGGVC